MDNYKAIEQKLRNRTPFRGNSMHGNYNPVSKAFEVYSYVTLIAMHRDGVGAVTDHKYSTTTSRHQNLVRKAWGI